MLHSVLGAAAILVCLRHPPALASPEYRYLDIDGKEHIGALVHLMEWSYVDIKNECDYLHFIGYDGIVISPPVEHVMLNKPSWKERYMPISLKLDSRSGTMDELMDMLQYCARKRALRVYADLNLNNMIKSTLKGEVRGSGGSMATPSQRLYEGIAKNEFHKFCKLTKADYKDPKKLRECEVDELQDLDNESETLQAKHIALMNQLIEMGISGFRLSMAKYTDPKQIRLLTLELSKTVYTITEEKPLMISDVNDLEESVVKAKDYERVGTWTDYGYARTVGRFFTRAKGVTLDDIAKLGGLKDNQALKPRETERMVFLYNHLTKDLKEPWIIKPNNEKAYRMAMAFMLSWPYGIPLVLSSYNGEAPPTYRSGNVKSPRPEGSNPADRDYQCVPEFNCEHRDPTIVKMVRFNEEVKDEPLCHMEGVKEGSWFAFSRGDLGFILFNLGTKDMTKKFHVKLKPGEYCDIASGNIEYNECTGRTVIVDEDGAFELTLPANDPFGYIAFHERSRVVPHIKALKVLLAKNEHINYFAGLAGRGLLTGGAALGHRAVLVKDALLNKDAGGQEVLEAGVGKGGAQLLTGAGSTLVGHLKNAAVGAQSALAGAQARNVPVGAQSALAGAQPPNAAPQQA